MDTQTRTQIIIAAIGAAGNNDDGFQSRVAENAAAFTAMLSETSTINKIISGVANSKVFSATLFGIKKEQSSTRGKATLKTKPSKFHEDGIEEARTERTDTAIGLAMARRLRGLVGHRVLLWVEVEEINGGASKVRVIRHVEDLGVDANYQLGEDGTLVEVAPAA